MKTKILFLLLGLSIMHSHVQGQGTTSVTKTQNYVLTATPRVATSNTAALTTENSLRTVQYFDGLGRPMETVQIGITPGKHDLATYQMYDAYGRNFSTWLPVEATNNNGAFVPLYNAIQDKARSTYNNEPKAYVYTKYENSPLNRVLEEYGPGIDWQDKGKSVKAEYLSNTGSYTCRLYTFTGTPSTIKFSTSGNYAIKQLYVTKVTDEDDKNITYEFKDKLGQVVLTRQMNEGNPHDTYYIYDDFGNLRIVIPPMLADKLTGSGINWTDATADVANYAYLYKYDECNRCIGKKLPGASWITYVYDKADRLIFSQDGEQKKAGLWKFSLPDALGRETVTGTFKTLQIGSTAKAIAPGCLNDVVVTTVFSKATNIFKGYTTPGITLGTPVALTVNYYDSYDFMGYNGVPASTDTHIKYEAVSGFGTQHTGSCKGLLTGTITASLDVTSKILYSVMYYDYRGRVIQTKSNNHMNNFSGGYEKEYIAYNFAGQPVKRRHIHIASGKTTLTEDYTYEYDHAGRLKNTFHQLTELTTTGAKTVKPRIALVQYGYDNLGRVKTVNPIQQFRYLGSTYTYNIRSWMESITSWHFLEKLTYNYNGDIKTQQWTQSNQVRTYTLGYDGLSRMKKADYTGDGKFGTTYEYDKQGNISKLTRYGSTTAGTSLLDNLKMTYTGNKLTKAEQIDKKTSTTYSYDLNGNMNKDSGKGITSIKYNYLNLPAELVISKAGLNVTNKYVYAADGRKLRVSKGSSTTDYCGNVIYENNKLKRLLVEGGYYENGKYHAFVKDHLGNTRMVGNQDATTLQGCHYYPFGKDLAVGWDESGQPYKYNGKELDKVNGLDLYDYGARYMDTQIGRFTTMDPLAEKYYSISPYAYCANNPVRFVDSTGMYYTDYRNERGELLYKTDDGLSDIIIVRERNEKEFKAKLNDLYDENKLNDANANIEELHSQGVKIEKLKDELMTGNASLDVGIERGYSEAFNNKKVGALTKIVRFIATVEDENAKVNAAYSRGKILGTSDREKGRMNKLEPYSGLKKNDPLLRVPNLKPIKKYPGVGLPPN